MIKQYNPEMIETRSPTGRHKSMAFADYGSVEMRILAHMAENKQIPTGEIVHEAKINGSTFTIERLREPKMIGSRERHYRLWQDGSPATGGQWHYTIEGALCRIDYITAGRQAAQIEKLLCQVNELEGELARTHAAHREMREAISSFVAAWNSQTPGSHSIRSMDDWLNSERMKEAVGDLKKIAGHVPLGYVTLRQVLRTALGHIEHMAAWIARTNRRAENDKAGFGWFGDRPGTYSFESLGEDIDAMRRQLAAPPCPDRN